MNEQIKDCTTCERRDKRTGGRRCRVFIEKPENCWAWTDDPDWDAKVEEAVKRYKEGRFENEDRKKSI